MRAYQNTMTGYYCADCDRTHRSVFFHNRAIEAQMKVDRSMVRFHRQRLVDLTEEEQSLARQFRSLWWFTLIAIALLTVYVSLH